MNEVDEFRSYEKFFTDNLLVATSSRLVSQKFFCEKFFTEVTEISHRKFTENFRSPKIF